MKKVIFIITCLFIALTVTAQKQYIQGSNKKAKATKTVTAFSQIIINGSFDVKLIQESSSSDNTITLKGADNIVNLLEVKVTDGTLTIGLPEGMQFKAHKSNRVKIKIPVKELSDITLNGSGKIYSNGIITKDINITLNGSGSIKMWSKAQNINTTLMGPGHIEIKGYTDTFTCKLIGNGTIEAQKLETDTTHAVISGSGNINVSCQKSIIGRIDGAGIMAFNGNPYKQDLKRKGNGVFLLL